MAGTILNIRKTCCGSRIRDYLGGWRRPSVILMFELSFIVYIDLYMTFWKSDRGARVRGESTLPVEQIHGRRLGDACRMEGRKTKETFSVVGGQSTAVRVWQRWHLFFVALPQFWLGARVANLSNHSHPNYRASQTPTSPFIVTI